jgi:DNA-binding transcriptional LysR family regulator
MDSPRLINSLTVFVDTVRAGSFSAVARRYGVAASSIARQIDALEKDLGLALFSRSTRSLRATEPGELLYKRALRILEDMADTRREVAAFNDEVQGALRITCLPTFGRRYVVPALSLLAETHPRVTTELDLTERLADPAVEKLDAALRFGELPDSTRIAQRIATQRYVICAAPGYLARYGTPGELADLTRHRLIDKRHASSPLGWREVLGPLQAAADKFVFESDDYEAQRTFLLGSGGIARLPDWVVGQDVQAGELIELTLKDLVADPASGIYLVRAITRPTAKLRAFAVALQQVIGKRPAWLC